jgi:hypothetical protein
MEGVGVRDVGTLDVWVDDETKGAHIAGVREFLHLQKYCYSIAVTANLPEQESELWTIYLVQVNVSLEIVEQVIRGLKRKDDNPILVIETEPTNDDLAMKMLRSVAAAYNFQMFTSLEQLNAI